MKDEHRNRLAGERVLTDRRRSFRQYIYGVKAAATVKSIVADCLDGVWNGNRSQRFASQESTCSDCGYRASNLHGIQRTQALESGVSDSRNRVADDDGGYEGVIHAPWRSRRSVTCHTAIAGNAQYTVIVCPIQVLTADVNVMQ